MTHQRSRERFSATPDFLELGNYTITNLYYNTDNESVKVLDCKTYNRDYFRTELCQDELHPGPPYKTGGPFNKWDIEDGGLTVMNSSTYEQIKNVWYRYRYQGGFVCNESPESIFPDLASHDYMNDLSVLEMGDVEGFGAEAWNKFKPGQPTSDLAVFLAELKETPRMLMTSAFAFNNVYKALRSGAQTGKKMSKTAADNYLNTQFGWLPFLGDLRRFYETCKDLDKLINQLKRDQGQWVKRAGTVGRSEETIRDDGYNATKHYPYLGSLWSSYPHGSSRVTVKKFQDVWFAGRFRYVIPTFDGSTSRWQQAAYLYGLRVSPSVVWNLTPWSWLVDWFSNAGDVIANWETSDTIAAKYAYVMGTTKLEGTVNSMYNLITGPINATWKYKWTRKSRVPASPFGFGLSPDAFTGRQWSILSALGITRLR